jgi:hypothetical protein
VAVLLHDATPVTSGNSYTTPVDATDLPSPLAVALRPAALHADRDAARGGTP